MRSASAICNAGGSVCTDFRWLNHHRYLWLTLDRYLAQFTQILTRQFTFGRVTHTGWQQMFAPLYQDARPWPANSHISGPDAGKLTPPYTFRALVLDGVPDGTASRGAIYIDDVQALN